MLVCPSCLHQNPEGAVHCEACYTVLPAVTHCPYCGATVQVDASFCGQCGSNLRVAASGVADIQVALPEKPVGISEVMALSNFSAPAPTESESEFDLGALFDATAALPGDRQAKSTLSQIALPPVSFATETTPRGPVQTFTPTEDRTQLQHQCARLVHLQTNTAVELPQSLNVIHLGKPNDRIPPDVDVAGFPNSEVVSRIHADIRVEGDSFFIEDTGSANGTYINNLPLPPGNRHRLRVGDRIALGKGDLVTFLFQLN